MGRGRAGYTCCTTSRHSGCTAVNLTGVGTERLLRCFQNKARLCFNRDSRSWGVKAETAQRESHAGLESWQRAPCLRDVGASSQTYSICWKLMWSSCDSLMCLMFIDCICLYLRGKNSNINILEHPVIWSPSDCNLWLLKFKYCWILWILKTLYSL